MRRTGWAAGLAALLVLTAAVASCGGKPDPLVGTWRSWPGHGPRSQTPLIITKNGDGYVATLVFWGPGDQPASPRPTSSLSMKRSGDTLTGSWTTNGMTKRAEIRYDPSSGHLAVASSGPPDSLSKPYVYVKVSESTAYPTTP